MSTTDRTIRRPSLQRRPLGGHGNDLARGLIDREDQHSLEQWAVLASDLNRCVVLRGTRLLEISDQPAEGPPEQTKRLSLDGIKMRTGEPDEKIFLTSGNAYLAVPNRCHAHFV